MRGGYGTSDHGNLADRRAGPSAEPPPVVPPRPASPARHCLVDGEPALLVEWRRTPAAWEGRIVTLALVDGLGWVTQEYWLAAELISPA